MTPIFTTTIRGKVVIFTLKDSVKLPESLGELMLPRIPEDAELVVVDATVYEEFSREDMIILATLHHAVGILQFCEYALCTQADHLPGDFASVDEAIEYFSTPTLTVSQAADMKVLCVVNRSHLIPERLVELLEKIKRLTLSEEKEFCFDLTSVKFISMYALLMLQQMNKFLGYKLVLTNVSSTVDESLRQHLSDEVTILSSEDSIKYIQQFNS